MEDKKIQEMQEQLTTLQSRVSKLTDQLAIMANDLRVTQGRVLEDMRLISKQIAQIS